MSLEDAQTEVESSPEEFLGMSDEDFANLDAAFLAAPGDTDPDPDVADDEDEDPADDTTAEDTDEEPGAEGAEGDEDDDDDAEDDAPDADSGDDSDADDADPDDTDKDTGDDKSDEPVDYEAAYKRLTAPFKANGKEMQVDNVDDAIRLMQMGANYNRKMAALKPNLKLMKTLEKNQISEEKLNFLIDLEKGNPAAIAQLLKSSKIDPQEMDLDQGDEYQAADHSVDDRELALDSVVDEIKDTDTYPQTLQIVTKDWDAASKQTVANAPQLLKIINDHVASGIYDLISTEVEKERMFGRLGDMSDIEAYKTVGDALDAQGRFAHLTQSQGPGPQSRQADPTPTPDKSKEAAKRRDKKRAASPTKAASPSGPPADFNPLALSDDEFEKQFDSKYL